MAEEVVTLTRKRAIIKGQLTRIYNFATSLPLNVPDVVECQARLQKLLDLWKEFDNIQGRIEEIDMSEAQAQEREAFEAGYYRTVAELKRRIEPGQSRPASDRARASTESEQINGGSQVQRVRLPILELPKFDGTYAQWLQFRDTFQALIDNNSVLEKIQKFHYLKSCLQGDAAQVLQSLEVSADNYAIAWSLLKERFENKKLLVYQHIHALFDMSPIVRESSMQLRKLVDETQKHIRVLKTLGEPVDSWNSIIIHMVISRADINTKRKWETETVEKEAPTFQELLDFLSRHCTVLEALQPNKSLATSAPSSSARKGEKVSAHVSQIAGRDCVICCGNHAIYNCTKFKELSIAVRMSEVRRHRLCFNCLRKDHTADRCTAGGCRRCGQKHNTWLHSDSKMQGTATEAASKPVQASTRDSTAHSVVADSQNDLVDQANYSVMANAVKCSSQVLLATASVKMYDRLGREHVCRAFLDARSQTNIIRRGLCERLQLSEREIEILLSGVGCGRADATGTVSATIHSAINEFKVKLQFLVMDRITEHTPSRRVDMSALKIPKNIRLSDQRFGEPGEIDMLLGGGVFWNLLCIGQIKLGRSLPTLQKTKLGWIVAGNAPVPAGRIDRLSATLCAIVREPDLDQQMERFWVVEDGPLQLGSARNEDFCEKEFRSTHRRSADGRFIVNLPFREEPSLLGDSRESALRRLRSVGRRLDRDTNLRTQYAECLADYLRSGHMSRIDGMTEPTGGFVYYLPHHAVVKEESTTTKLRIVFDASCKTTSGKSLNDILRVGPTIQQELFEIILRFRQHQYVLTGDIEKMYRQIYINPEQRNLQRVLWRADSTSSVEEFRLNTVTFGVASAPFLAVRCLHQLAYECRPEEPGISEVILRDFYMDDLITGADDAEELKRVKEGVSRILLTGGFPMHKWKSNVAEGIGDPEQADRNMQKSLGDQVKTLGLYWDVAADSLTYRVSNIPIDNRVTKRRVLSIISQIYDPLGLVNPVIVQAKIMLQRLWQCKIGWDESLPEDLHTAWKRYYDQLKMLEEVRVPRRIVLAAPIRIEVHGFSDASEKAYGACLYLRSSSGENERRCRLICAKSRVAPVKKISLPRLELCGALLLARLMSRVAGALTLRVDERHYWCDSTVVLAWISREPSQWNTFVANRVAEIQKTSSRSQWHHVRSEENPADVLSRGVGPERLKSRDLWWRGPAWLEEGEIEYPLEPAFLGEAPEKRRLISMVVNLEAGLDVWRRYSSLRRLKAVIAYCLRFAYNCRRVADRRAGWITVRELDQAVNVILKHHQGQHFAQEIAALQSRRPISKKSRLLSLNPFVDDVGMLRVGGRLKNAPLSYSQKFPVIVASRDHLTELIIRDAHLKNMHAGPEALLSIIREQYWIVAGRSAIRRVLHKCLVCYRFSCKSPQEIMGDLPRNRVTPGRAFLNVGVDYGGPFNIKFTRNTSAKAYLCLFVCFATRAVHLELVSDLSTPAFLNDLRRFIARRGKCINIYSDNGTNFVGANNELQGLRRLLQDPNHHRQVDAFLSKQSIQWHFSPPYAPHMGGLWEAGIKSAKTRLKKVLGEALLTFEEFYTLLTEVEACLNSRPLMPMSSDPSDLTALTPGHFIIGAPLNAIQQADLIEVSTNRLNRYQLLLKLQQHFWARWSQEYLSQLQSRSKWRSAASDRERVKPDDMMILKEHRIPLRWRLGRIVEVHPDKEGHIRVVSIRTDSGIVQRALTKICILPISD